MRKKPVRVYSLGGFGNQLFTNFFGASIASRLQTELEIDSYLVPLGSNNSRRNMLTQLNDIYKPTVHKEKFKRFNSKLFFYFNNKIRFLDFLFNKVNESKINYPKFKFKSGQKFFGYFQDWFYVDYFSKGKSSLYLQTLNESANYHNLQNLAQSLKPICIHVRLGDYLNFPTIYKILPIKYYKFCIEKELNKNPNREIWVFIEDFEQLKSYDPSMVSIANRVIDRSSGISDLESFQIMARSSTLITANSTFSLWAAWFVWKNGNTAYVPYQSYIEGVSSDLMDERWNRYDFEKDIYFPGKFNQEKYEQLEREFLSKFA